MQRPAPCEPGTVVNHLVFWSVNGMLKGAGAKLRHGLVWSLTAGPVAAAWSPFLGSRATVLMFHRFGAPARTRGHSPGQLRRILAYLRKHHYVLMDLEDLIRGVRNGKPLPRRAIAITFDDGYEELFDVALPILSEFDVPATFFLTTGFTDGLLWLWWDQIEYLLDSPGGRVTLEFGGSALECDLSTEVSRSSAISDLTERCKRVPRAEVLAVIERLATMLGREIPLSPPEGFRAMTWEQARIAERFGIRCGPGSVSHPVLAPLDDATAAYEIEHSWNRVRAELARPMPVFCYPNGRLTDFGEREIKRCAALGLLGAVTAEPDYLLPQRLRSSPSALYELPRFSGPESLPQLAKITSGLEILLSFLPRSNGSRTPHQRFQGGHQLGSFGGSAEPSISGDRVGSAS